MKIGLISFHSFWHPGGIKKHVLGLHKEFKKKGIQSKIIVPRRNKSENYGKDVILLGTSFPMKFSGSQADFCVNFNPLVLAKVLKEENFDILHFHNFGFPSAFQILERSKALNILTIHADVEGSKFLKNFPTFLYVFNKIIQWKIDGVIGVSKLTFNALKDFKGLKTVIPNGIDLKEFNPEVPSVKKFSDGKLNLLFVGRIEERKGLIYLLRSYKILEKEFSDLRLIIVGEGDLKEKCQKWARKNNLKEVCFVGQKTDEELVSYFNTADIFVSPAIFGESFGIVLLEAMACALPVVAFSNDGYKSFLKGKNGEKFLVKPKDYNALAKKIGILIKDPELRKATGEWGKREAEEYAWPKVAGQILAFYKLCQKRKQKKKPKREFPFDKIDEMIRKMFTPLDPKNFGF